MLAPSTTGQNVPYSTIADACLLQNLAVTHLASLSLCLAEVRKHGDFKLVNRRQIHCLQPLQVAHGVAIHLVMNAWGNIERSDLPASLGGY